MNSSQREPGRPDRPRVVTAACWLVFGGAAMVAGGALASALLSFDTLRASASAAITDQQLHRTLALYRGAGTVCALAAVGLAVLVMRCRGGDVRFWRATIALALAVVVLLGLVAVFLGAHPLALIGLLPVIVGTLMLRRPAASDWFHLDSRDGRHD
jgi:hypothetical protein